MFLREASSFNGVDGGCAAGGRTGTAVGFWGIAGFGVAVGLGVAVGFGVTVGSVVAVGFGVAEGFWRGRRSALPKALALPWASV